jgi:hypothetical protein
MQTGIDHPGAQRHYVRFRRKLRRVEDIVKPVGPRIGARGRLTLERRRRGCLRETRGRSQNQEPDEKTSGHCAEMVSCMGCDGSNLDSENQPVRRLHLLYGASWLTTDH